MGEVTGIIIAQSEIPGVTPKNPDCDIAKHVNVVNFLQLADAIADALVGAGGEPFKASFVGDTGDAGIVINEVTPAEKLRKYTSVIISCRREVEVIVLNNAEQIASVRMGPANPSATLLFSPIEKVSAGNNFTIQFNKSFTGPEKGIEIFLRGVEESA